MSLSVVVLNYNYGRFLKQSVDSLLAQTVPPDEILIVDDHSTDESLLVMHNYVQCDRLRIMRNPSNLGTSASINEGVKNASSEWVFCLSADDYVEKRLVEELKSAIASNDADIIYYDLFVVGLYAGDLAERITLPFSSEHGRYLWSFPNPSSEVIAEINKSNFIHGSSAFRKSLWERLGGFREIEAVHEDHDFFARAIDCGARLRRIPLPLLNYRRHSKEQRNITKNLEVLVAVLRDQVAQRDSEIATFRENLSPLRDVARIVIEEKSNASQTLNIGDAKVLLSDPRFIESILISVARLENMEEGSAEQGFINAFFDRGTTALEHSESISLSIALLALAALVAGPDIRYMGLIRSIALKHHLEPIDTYFQSSSERRNAP